MKTNPRSSGKMNLKCTEDDIKQKSWTNIIPSDIWDEIIETVNLSSEYPKSTPTAARHVTYASYLNKTAEMIRLNSKGRFRTDTEIFRISLHHGIAFLYTIFVAHPNDSKKTRGNFFYEALQDVNAKMERATMISIISEKFRELLELVKHEKMDNDEANEELDRLLDAVPEQDREYIKAFFERPEKDNVMSIKKQLVKKFKGLL